jgi:EAL domain-containing protein (putative c-di-GMP-specific phosphodiesterase class I)
VALDDFGTGYSSLAYLREFPVDCLKIDRAFGAGVADPGSDDDGLVRTIVELGRTRGMIVIAEGIEEAAQHHELHRLGCKLGRTSTSAGRCRSARSPTRCGAAPSSAPKLFAASPRSSAG